MTTVYNCQILDFSRITRPEGNLTPVEALTDVPFDIARVYYLYDVPGGESRGGHAHKELQQVIMSVMGSFTVELNDGRRTTRVCLNRAYYGLYVPRMIWRELVDFSSGGICLVLASLPFEEAEYIRDYQEFCTAKGAEKS